MFDTKNFIKYILFLIVITPLVFFLFRDRLGVDEIIFIGLTATMVFLVLDKTVQINNFAGPSSRVVLDEKQKQQHRPFEKTVHNEMQSLSKLKDISINESDVINFGPDTAKIDILYGQEKSYYAKIMEDMGKNKWYSTKNTSAELGIDNKYINVIETESLGKSPNLIFNSARTGIGMPVIDLPRIQNQEKLLKEFDSMKDIGSPNTAYDKNNYNYKLMFGDYAWGVLYSGYNQKLQSYNSEITELYSRYPEAIEVSQLYHHSHSDQKHEQFQEKQNLSEYRKSMSGGASDPTTNTNDCSSTANTVNIIPKPQDILIYAEVLDKSSRKIDILHSGDLIMISYGNAIMQRGDVNSQVAFSKPLKYVGTNLSKVRFVSKTHNLNKITPLHYGDVVHIKHNIYTNNKNEFRYIKHGSRLQSHQEGALFNEYVIYSSSDIKDTGEVKADLPFILGIPDSAKSDSFLKVEPNGSVSCNSVQKNASNFTLSIYRPSELHDRHLDIAQGDIIFP